MSLMIVSGGSLGYASVPRHAQIIGTRMRTCWPSTSMITSPTRISPSVVSRAGLEAISATVNAPLGTWSTRRATPAMGGIHLQISKCYYSSPRQHDEDHCYDSDDISSPKPVCNYLPTCTLTSLSLRRIAKVISPSLSALLLHIFLKVLIDCPSTPTSSTSSTCRKHFTPSRRLPVPCTCEITLSPRLICCWFLPAI
jgi:hypothetical protein